MAARGNGLSAASYVPLRDLDPRVTDGALEALREAGVAAYAITASGQTATGLDLVGRPYDRPIDRLYVDASARETAAQVIDAAFDEDRTEDPPDGDEPVLAGTAGSSPAAVPDLDQAFEQIIAGFDRTDADKAATGPADEAVAGSAEDTGALPASPTRPAAEEDDHFIPPPPPPLPELDTVTKLAWAGVIGGPLILIASVFGIAFPRSVLIFGVIAFVAGFATLVARLKDRPDGAGPDDGAVI